MGKRVFTAKRKNNRSDGDPHTSIVALRAHRGFLSEDACGGGERGGGERGDGGDGGRGGDRVSRNRLGFVRLNRDVRISRGRRGGFEFRDGGLGLGLGFRV